MKILIAGSGGREHALAWKIAQSPRCSAIYCAPGNAGTAMLGTNVPIAISDLDGLVHFATTEKIGLVVVGPDDALAAGLADRLKIAGIPVFGPTAAAARLESSKSFAKDFMLRHGIPTANAGSFSDISGALAFLDTCSFPIVVKADGLALGKGVIIAKNHEEASEALRDMLERGKFGAAGNRVLIEEYLTGPEASIHAMIGGAAAIPFPTAQDHKRAFDDDQGPNTGGMGTFSPAPAAGGDVWKQIRHEVIDKFMKGIRDDGIDYCGMLFPGLMLTQDGPKVLEFNCRFGDPETQVLLPRLKSDLVSMMLAAIDGTLADVEPEWDTRASVCVIMASGGYPGSYAKDKEITGLEALRSDPSIHLFHAGTRQDGNRIVTSGGRVLGVTALAEDLDAARAKAYEAVASIHFEGAFFRKDIATKGIRS